MDFFYKIICSHRWMPTSPRPSNGGRSKLKVVSTKLRPNYSTLLLKIFAEANKALVAIYQMCCSIKIISKSQYFTTENHVLFKHLHFVLYLKFSSNIDILILKNTKTNCHLVLNKNQNQLYQWKTTYANK